MASESRPVTVAAGWWLVAVAGCVEADDGVEVDDATGLVFGDLDIPDADVAAELGDGDAREGGEAAGQVGGEPAPQLGCVGVEQHGGGVVVAVRAQRPSEPRVGTGVAVRAGNIPAVRAAAGVTVPAGPAR